MGRQRRKYDKEFKTKMVLTVLKGEQTIQEMSRQYNISPTIISRWRDRFIEGGVSSLASEGPDPQTNGHIKELVKEVERRNQVIGELAVANKALKKNICGT